MHQHPTPKARRLRELIDKQTVVLPGAFNALTAMQIERAGFPALYVSGAGLSATRGLPDIGLLSMTEVASDAAIIAKAVTIPAIVDADTGFGPPLAVMRAIKEFEQAGLAGIQLEDQELPKKCGHLPGKRLVSTSEMVNKICAASDTRRDQDFFIVARTDARAVEGLDAAVRRARAYIDAIEQVLIELKNHGSQRELLGRMHTRQQLYDLLRYAEYEQRDRQFHSSDDDHANY
jgi:methylisocitrate lyase